MNKFRYQYKTKEKKEKSGKCYRESENWDNSKQFSIYASREDSLLIVRN
jgi:hypothetical protein